MQRKLTTRLAALAALAAVFVSPILASQAQAGHAPFVNSPGTFTTTKGDFTITTTLPDRRIEATSHGTTLDVVEQVNTGCSLVLRHNRKDVMKVHGSMCLPKEGPTDPLFLDDRNNIVAMHVLPGTGNQFPWEVQLRSDKGGVVLWTRRGSGVVPMQGQPQACKIDVKDASRGGAEQTWSGKCLKVKVSSKGETGQELVFLSDSGKKMQVIVWTPAVTNNFKSHVIVERGVKKN